VATDLVPLRAVLVRCSPGPLMPWQDMADGLRSRFDADVTVLGHDRMTSPSTVLAAIAKALACPGEPLLLVVTGIIRQFVRSTGDLWTLVLPSSVPGRPRSMVPLDRLMETAACAAAGRPLWVGLDVHVAEAEGNAATISAGELAERLTSACRTRLRWSPGIIIRAASSVERRASSVERLLDRALAAVALAGGDTDFDAAATHAADLARNLGVDVSAVRSGKSSPIRSVSRGPLLPDDVRADLFALNEGSRLDAALELVKLSEDGHEIARRELNDLATRDPSPTVMDYAERLARRSAQPTLAMLRWQGRVPRHMFDAARHDLFLPELLPQAGGRVPIGTDDADPAEAPRHWVEISPFRLSRTPVTDRQYLTFLIAEGGPCPDHWATETEQWERDIDRPVVNVSFHDARRYCAWLDRLMHAQGTLTEAEEIMLPSEVEWETAAGNGRGDRYPWGDWPDPARGNIRATGLSRPAPVGWFSPGGDNATGCVDLIGNVWEWTRSAWGPSYRVPAHGYPYVADDGRENPDLRGVRRVVRGGAFYYATECADSHTRNRVVAEERHPGGGFRVAVTTVKPR
jgi:formylglycine-generating enzyme required for sulfatase activity